jgi:muramoyltetrapeptide carboxypeptidase
MAIHRGVERIYTQENIAAVENALFNPSINFDLQNFIRNTAVSFSGKLIGGNLSLIYAALGTPEQPKTDGAVLFIEDLDEYLYHVDRMMTALKRAGILKNISALLVGGMSDMKDNAVPFGSDAETIITNCCSEYHFHIIFNFPAGHTDKNICLKLGAHCTFDGKYFKQ